jgi:malonyl-CoA O-methyltransferase
MVKSSIKKQIQQNFSDAADHYDRWAGAQKKSADRLVSLLPKRNYEEVLDLGCGTGFLIDALMTTFAPKTITGIDFAPSMVEACRRRWTGQRFICVDAEEFEPSATYDLIASNFTFQWIEDIRSTLRKYVSHLKSGGTLALAVPVQGSLRELRETSLQANGRPIQLLEFPEPDSILAVFTEMTALWLEYHLEDVLAYFDQPLDVLKSLKGIGASFGNDSAYTVGEMRKLVKIYRNYYCEEKSGHPLTYRVLFLIVRENG